MSQRNINALAEILAEIADMSGWIEMPLEDVADYLDVRGVHAPFIKRLLSKNEPV